MGKIAKQPYWPEEMCDKSLKQAVETLAGQTLTAPSANCLPAEFNHSLSVIVWLVFRYLFGVPLKHLSQSSRSVVRN